MTNKKTYEKTHTILLTGARSLCALELARHLKIGGHRVLAADTSAIHPLRFSNAIQKFFIVPSPRFHEEDFVGVLQKIVREEKVDLIIPVWEEVGYLSRYRDQFPSSCTLFCSSFETVHMLHHKGLFIEKLNGLGFKTPYSVLLTSKEELQQLKMAPPFILKACYSRAARQVYRITNNVIPEIAITPAYPWIAQEYLQGTQYCSYSVCNQGKVLAHSVYPVVFTMDGSSCLSFEAVNYPKVFEWIQKLVGAIGYTGQIAFDFIETEKGELYAIECNPRATSGIHLFRPEDGLHRAFTQGAQETLYAQVGSTQQVALGMILYGSKRAWQEGKFYPYLQKVCKTKDVVFNIRDMKPFLFQPLVLASYWWQSKQKGLSIPHLFTYDLDWNKR